MKRLFKNFIKTFIAKHTGFIYNGPDVHNNKGGFGFLFYSVDSPSVYDPARIAKTLAWIIVGSHVYKFSK
jgi:hypothetical protein